MKHAIIISLYVTKISSRGYSSTLLCPLPLLPQILAPPLQARIIGRCPRVVARALHRVVRAVPLPGNLEGVRACSIYRLQLRYVRAYVWMECQYM